jgi:hypothetical protein
VLVCHEGLEVSSEKLGMSKQWALPSIHVQNPYRGKAIMKNNMKSTESWHLSVLFSLVILDMECNYIS